MAIANPLELLLGAMLEVIYQMTTKVIILKRGCLFYAKFFLLKRLAYRLGMNNIMDISNGTEGSHVAQVDDESQSYLKNEISRFNRTEQIGCQYDCEPFENIIK